MKFLLKEGKLMKKGLTIALSTIAGAAVSGAAGYTMYDKKCKEVDAEFERANKNAAIIKTMGEWIEQMQDGKSIVSFFKKNNYRRIAIYGMHYIGERMLRELQDSSIEVVYAIDRRGANIKQSIPVYNLQEGLEDVDAIIVTPVYYFNQIEDELEEYFDCPIISFDEVLHEER